MESAVLKKAVAATSAIYKADDRDALFGAIDTVCNSLGFDNFLLGCHKMTRQELVMDSTFTTISDAFLDDYERLDWFDSDMNIGRVFDVEHGFFWDSSTDRDTDGRKQSFIDYLYANDMCAGLMAPLSHRPGTASVFSLIAKSKQTFDPGIANAAKIIGNAALTKSEMLGLCPAISPDEVNAKNALSALQHDILGWVAEGKSNLDIGTIMDLKERVVRYHVSEVLRKLGVATRAQAAATWRFSMFSLRG